jgi:OmpA-OmpF porin, OOP family
MKHIFGLLLFLIFYFPTLGQVTENPKIKRKSTIDVFISKIEILENKTLVSLYYQSKTPKEALQDYLLQNPQEAEQLRRMDPFMRQLFLQQMQQQVGGSTISFQPGSYLKTSDGKKYKFLSATNIPKAPERREVEPGKRYNFKVSFEKLPKGFELIDLIESKADKSKDFTFWNFYGIKINNPAEDGKQKVEKYTEEEQEEEIEEEAVVIVNTEFRIFGKIKDAETENTISAKISCEDAKNSIDSLQTSKSGSYEFIIKPDSTVVLIVSALGYQTHEESMNLKLFKNKEFLQKDIFLEKSIASKPEITKKEEPKPEENPPILKNEPKPIIGVPSENKEAKAAFKLDKVYFKLGESTILPESFEQLDKLVEYLKENSALKIQIEGHTDNQGDAKLNKKLSLERAFNVREYLVKKGVVSKRIKFAGLGDSQPISSNNKEEDRKNNRRVEYRFID